MAALYSASCLNPPKPQKYVNLPKLISPQKEMKNNIGAVLSVLSEAGLTVPDFENLWSTVLE